MINISSMELVNIADAVRLWKILYNKYCQCHSFPNFTSGGLLTVKTYLKDQIDKGNAIIATENGEMIGYMAWMCIDFHNERTAFLPIVGHAASFTEEIRIYNEMYYYASQKWVLDDRFNHLWMTFYDDKNLLYNLYDIGFGSYVIDACQSTATIGDSKALDYEITYADENDVDALLEFANSSNEYYANSPIFLKRNCYRKENIEELVKNDYALIARDNELIIGAMSFTTNQDFHFEHLTTPDSAYIKAIGAFIHPNYRKKGIGTALLKRIFAACSEKGKSHLHVSFESSNPNAIQFWPKYFKPAIRSVRRTINKDANLCK